MEKILLIICISLLCFGCGKTEKNITINIYENKDNDSEVEIKKEEIKEEQQEIVVYKENIVSNDTQSNNIENSDIDFNAANDTDNNESTSKIDQAKEWYNQNKDELKAISDEIIQNDINTVNGLVGSVKDWYSENKDELINNANEIYYNDKETISNLYDKFKN